MSWEKVNFKTEGLAEYVINDQIEKIQKEYKLDRAKAEEVYGEALAAYMVEQEIIYQVGEVLKRD